jgi:hypothetical protein
VIVLGIRCHAGLVAVDSRALGVQSKTVRFDMHEKVMGRERAIHGITKIILLRDSDEVHFSIACTQR